MSISGLTFITAVVASLVAPLSLTTTATAAASPIFFQASVFSAGINASWAAASKPIITISESPIEQQLRSICMAILVKYLA